MNTRGGVLAWGLAPLLLLGPADTGPEPKPRLEEAYRANNRGVALLEQFEPERAAEEFRRALGLAPSLGLARANLAIALLNLPKLDAARDEATAAAALLPATPQPHYVLGLAARGLGDPETARAAFRRVVEIDPSDVGAHINLGQLHLQAGRYAEAVTEFRAALAAESYNATATYNLGLALARSGQTEEGARTMERFRLLREAGYGTVLGQSYPDQGRYAEAMASTGAEADLVDAAIPPARFADATAEWLGGVAVRLPGGRATAFDLDGDGDLDVHLVGPTGQRLLVNSGRLLVDATAAWGLEASQGGTGSVAGDVDNDGRPDLLVVGPEGARFWRNRDGRFADATAESGLGPGAARVAALVDADHDGDLDVVLAGSGARDRLLQNDGAARFKDVSDAAGLAAVPGSTVLVPTDFDDRRDVDLLLAGGGAPPRLYRNLRDGTFRDVAVEAGLPRETGLGVVAAADVTKDGRTDFFFAGEGAPGVLAASTGRSGFAVSPAPAGLAGARQAMFLDYDNDGLLDLVAATPEGWRLVRNVGSAGWKDVTEPALALGAGRPGAFTAGDLDGDGDVDLVALDQDGALRVLENREGRHAALRVRLAGRVSNRSAVGAKVDVRAGSLRQRMETSAATPPMAPASVTFGLGPRATADAVRVIWPAGILQTELVTPEAGGPRTALAVEELDRKPSSCPYLYAWDGERFAFVTDFMGGGEMGYWVAPGTFNTPDPDEYVRLTDAQLRPRAGRLEVRVTNELEEALFVDRLALLAIDHPAEVEVHPDEALRRAAPRYRALAVRDLREAAGALDEHGHDVRDRLARVDRVFVDDFAKTRFRGYAEEHTLTLDLGKDAGDDAVLLLTGWTDYAFSSDNAAAHQAGVALKPPRLEVEDTMGAWRTVNDDVGIPVGRPQTVLVEMAGRWRGPSRRARLVTNMRIYWDQVRVARTADPPRAPVRLEASRADLTERGFSAESSPDGREPFSYDYTRVSAAAPWKVFPGRYTRPGDVRELLAAVDDVFVLSPPGDEIALSFDARALPALPTGWRRTYLLHSDGFSKEMNLRSATPDELGPLPFHGMPSYPYAAPVRYPMTPQRRALWERYTTREVRGPVPSLEASLAREGR